MITIIATRDAHQSQRRLEMLAAARRRMAPIKPRGSSSSRPAPCRASGMIDQEPVTLANTNVARVVAIGMAVMTRATYSSLVIRVGISDLASATWVAMFRSSTVPRSNYSTLPRHLGQRAPSSGDNFCLAVPDKLYLRIEWASEPGNYLTGSIKRELALGAKPLLTSPI